MRVATIGDMSTESDRTASEHAERMIRELDEIGGRTRAAGRSTATGYPLIGWGLAWAVGYPALELFDGWLRIAVVVLVWAAAMVLSWVPLRVAVRTGTEGRLQIGWWVLMAASPFIVAAAQPVSLVHVALLLGALWSVGMVLYAIAMHDVPYAVVAAVGIVAAAVAGFQSLIGPLVFFGLLAGVPLACVGVVRLVQGARYV